MITFGMLVQQFQPARESKKIGQLWQPKKYINFAEINRTPPELEEKPMTQVVGDTVSIREYSQSRYAGAKSGAAHGFKVERFDTTAPPKDPYKLNINGKEKEVYGDVLVSSQKARVILGQGTIYIDYADEREDQEISLDADMRISWGENGEALVQTGSDALTAGNLVAKGANEVLVRFSGGDVVAGNGSVVLNYSSKKGHFSGGSGVSYRGSYTDSVFEYDKGRVDFGGHFTSSTFKTKGASSVFSGVFDYSEIKSGDTDDVYSGYYNASFIETGNGDNEFSGLFFGNSVVRAGSGKDSFSGRFINADIDAGDGDNSFGKAFDMLTFAQMTSDFTDSIIKAGSGNDSFFGASYSSRLDLGDGDNDTSGVFLDSFVKTGAGDDYITAMYSRSSSFDSGLGNDFVALGTAIASKVTVNAGDNEIVLGYNKNGGRNSGNAGSIYGGGNMLGRSRWITRSELDKGIDPTEFGAIRANRIDASEGRNTITVNSGEGTHVVRTGPFRKDSEEEDGVEESMNELQKRIDSELVQMGEDAPAAGGGTVTTENARKAGKRGRYRRGERAYAAASGIGAAGERAPEKQLRFMSVSGDAPRTEGVLGVSIDGGVGDVIALRADARYNLGEEAESPEVKPEEKLDQMEIKLRARALSAYDYFRMSR